MSVEDLSFPATAGEDHDGSDPLLNNPFRDALGKRSMSMAETANTRVDSSQRSASLAYPPHPRVSTNGAVQGPNLSSSSVAPPAPPPPPEGGCLPRPLLTVVNSGPEPKPLPPPTPPRRPADRGMVPILATPDGEALVLPKFANPRESMINKGPFAVEQETKAHVSQGA